MGRADENRKRRELKWDSEFIPCTKHPNRRCNRSRYVRAAGRQCGSCKSSQKIDGTLQSAHVRYDKSEQRSWRMKSTLRYKRIKENRP